MKVQGKILNYNPKLFMKRNHLKYWLKLFVLQFMILFSLISFFPPVLLAAGKWKLYESAKEYLADGTFDLDDGTNWKIALFLSTSNANTLGGTNDVYGDLTNEHANGNGYTTGGQALTNITWNRSGGTVTFDCDDAVWTASGGSITARFAVIYKDATVNSIVKPLLCICLLDTAPADVTATDGNTLTIQINASGIFTLSGADAD